MATTTSFLPLTTTFSGPPECSSLFVIPGTGTGIYAFDPGYPLKDPTAPKCAPDQALTWWQQETGAATYTDIGGPTFVCPEQYSTAAVIVQASRTLVGCCPQSYTFVNWNNPGFPGECSSALKPGLVTFISQGSDGVYSKTSSLVTTTTAIFGVQINGYITAGTASSTGSTSPTGSASTTSLTTSNSPSVSPAPSSEPSGLSVGAKAGIGAGVGALAGLLIVGGLLWYRRRRQHYAAVELASTEHAQEMSGGPNAYGGYYAPPVPEKPEKVTELSSASRPAELA